jgi:hypothetical protein
MESTHCIAITKCASIPGAHAFEQGAIIRQSGIAAALAVAIASGVGEKIGNRRWHWIFVDFL